MHNYVTPAVAAATIAVLALGGTLVASHAAGRTAANDGTPRGLSAAASGEPTDLTQPMAIDAVSSGPPFPVDAAGLTYGGIPDQGAAVYSEWPDLVAVALDADRVGFVRKEDLHDDPSNPADNPSTPAEMLAYQAKEAGMTVAVYAPDGVTVLKTEPLWSPTEDFVGDPDGSSTPEPSSQP